MSYTKIFNDYELLKKKYSTIHHQETAGELTKYNIMCLKIASALASKKSKESTRPENVICGVSCIVEAFWIFYQGTTKRNEMKQQQRTMKSNDELEETLGSLIRESTRQPIECRDSFSAILSLEYLGPLHPTFYENIEDINTELKFLHYEISDDLNISDDLIHYYYDDDDDKNERHRSRIIKETVEKINELVQTNTNQVFDELVTEDDLEVFKNSRLLMVTKSKYEGEWVQPFNNETFMDTFHTSKRSTSEIQMMSSIAKSVLVSDMKKELNATILLFPYKNGGNFLVYSPKEIASFQQLIMTLNTLTQGDTFERLLRSFKLKRSAKQVIPKFAFKSKFNAMSALKKIDQLSDVFNNDLSFTRLFDDRSFSFTHLKMENITDIVCNEEGTKTKSKTSSICFDYLGRDKCYRINRPFLFFTLTPTNHICDVGIFMDGVKDDIEYEDD